MPIRNPFAKRSDGGAVQDENVRPSNATRPTFEKVDTVGSKASSSMSISTGRSDQEVAEYKMSVVNDSGVYLPPSPPEKKGFWPRRTNPSTTSTSNHRACLADNEPFSISRESFDSYRRSFDISARSPIIQPDNTVGRQSLDSARVPRLPRSAIGGKQFEAPEPTKEEGFEEVGLNDEQNKTSKKKSFFSKFGDSNDNLPAQTSGSGSGSTSRFHITGRKRGQSGQGAELGDMPARGESTATEVN